MTLPGLEWHLKDGLFFAIQPTASAAEQSLEMGRNLYAECNLSGNLVQRECLHVSLVGLGAFEGNMDGIVARACEVGSALIHSSCELTFDRIASFENALVLRASDDLPEISKFYHVLGDALVQTGLLKSFKKRFTPHMTLHYRAPYLPSRTIDPLRWIACEFVLVRSLLGRTTHHILGRWSFNGPAGFG